MAKVTRLTLDQGGSDKRRLHIRDIKDDAVAPLDTVGADLRAARVRAGAEIDAISQTLRIKPEHLMAIEESAYQQLPGAAYAAGFVRAYAEYVGLDAADAVRRYKAETAGRLEQASVALPVPEDERVRPHGSILILAFLFALGAYGVWFLSTSADQMLARVPAPPSPAATPAAVPAPAATGPVASPPAAGAPVATAPAPEAPVAAVGDPAAASGETPAEPDVAAVTPQPAETPAAEPPAPDGKIYLGSNSDARVILRIREKAWVRLEDADRRVLIQRDLEAGDQVWVPNRVGMVLSTRNAGGVEVVLDGMPMGLIGPAGRVEPSLSLDPQALVDRMNAEAPD